MSGNCNTCAHFHAHPQAGDPGDGPPAGAGTCWRYPPVPFRYAVQSTPTPANPQGVAVALEGLYPPVIGQLHTCGEWQPTGKPS